MSFPQEIFPTKKLKPPLRKSLLFIDCPLCDSVLIMRGTIASGTHVLCQCNGCGKEYIYLLGGDSAAEGK